MTSDAAVNKGKLMANATFKVDLENLEPVKQITRALFRVLHEVEASDPTLLPQSLVEQAEAARAVVDEWRRPDRHRRRHNRP